MTGLACRFVLTPLLVAVLAGFLAGCAPPPKKVDPEEAKRQLRELKGFLEKEQAEKPQ